VIFYYVSKDQVSHHKALEMDAIPYYIECAEYSHYWNQSSFDHIVRKHGLTDPAIIQLADIVRIAGTHSFELAPQAAGLWVISAGLSHTVPDDHQMLEVSLKLYDVLYAWPNTFKKKNMYGNRNTDRNRAI
jgi:hypothetical protein